MTLKIFSYVAADIPHVKIIGLIGKNGVGKSTTLESILNLVNPNNSFQKVYL